MSATLALALSVAMHVVWNLMARHLPRQSNPLWWVLLAHLVLFGPLGFRELASAVHWTPELLLLLTISATANVVYFMGLARAYEHAPVALVYPLVRSSPLLIAIWGTLFFEQHLPASAWLGIAISVLGVWFMASSARQATEARALPWALLAMLATSVYSLTDKAATQQIHSFSGLLGFVSVGYLASWISITLRMRLQSRRWIPEQRIGMLPMVAGGACIGLAYALVIHAMRELTAAEAVAYTNAGIVLATTFSIFLFKEKDSWKTRLTGVALIIAGLLVLSLRY